MTSSTCFRCQTLLLGSAIHHNSLTRNRNISSCGFYRQLCLSSLCPAPSPPPWRNSVRFFQSLIQSHLIRPSSVFTLFHSSTVGCKPLLSPLFSSPTKATRLLKQSILMVALLQLSLTNMALTTICPGVLSSGAWIPAGSCPNPLQKLGREQPPQVRILMACGYFQKNKADWHGGTRL